MPAIALAFPLTGQMTRIVRTAMVEELDKDYVRMARGAGVPEKVVVGINVLRNALITPVTTLGLKIGYLMGGAVVIEVIFNLPGMGTAILQGVQGNEANLVQGVVIVVALAFIIINIVVDMLYLLINPAHQDGVDYGKDSREANRAAREGCLQGGSSSVAGRR